MKIPLLNPGDTVAIVAPAKAIEKEHVVYAKQLLENQGYNVVVSDHCDDRYYYFSGTIEDRLNDFQKVLDDPSINAILCARGGYGSIQIVDKLDWSGFEKHPKWLIGFSDITIFHKRLFKMGYPSIHGTMPLNFKTNSPEALSTLFESLTNEHYSIEANGSVLNKAGHAEGTLIGGNLSILYSLVGTNDQGEYENCILFIEEIGEYIYAIDRILHSMNKANLLSKISGLIVGGMTDIKDTDEPFGIGIQELILSHFQDLYIPIAFDFPAGHIDDNRALRFGAKVQLEVTQSETKLHF